MKNSPFMSAVCQLIFCFAMALPAIAQSGAIQGREDWDGLVRQLEAGTDPFEIIDAWRSGPPATGDLGTCEPIPVDGLPGLTNDRHYFLSEILQGDVPLDSPVCGEQLACFLQQVPGTVHSNATLVIDRQCVSEQTLVLPSRFTLSGVGLAGEGALVFDLPQGASALRFADATGVLNRFSVIRDLTIANAGCCGQTGVEIQNSGVVELERVQITGFAIGVYGEYSYSVNIEQSRIFGNGFNIALGFDTTTWRIRDSTLNQGLLVGLVLGPESRGNLLSAGRVESNRFTGVLVFGHFNTVEHTWLEGNGGPSLDGIKIGASAMRNRILGNLISKEEVSLGHPSNEICFSTGLGLELPDTCNID